MNLIMEKEVVKELIQENLNTDNLVTELTKLLEDNPTQKNIQADYLALKNKLYSGEKASEVAADIILRTLQHK